MPLATPFFHHHARTAQLTLEPHGLLTGPAPRACSRVPTGSGIVYNNTQRTEACRTEAARRGGIGADSSQ